jgi:murein DD-endopeptidase MepM/ murein hydrolase activator NlpD
MLQFLDGKPWLLYVLLGASVGLNIIQTLNRPAGSRPATTEAELPQTPQAMQARVGSEASPADTSQGSLLGPERTVIQGSTHDGYQTVRSPVHGTLSRTFQETAGTNGNAVSAVFARLFAWDLDLRKDMMRGDEIATAWRSTKAGEIEMPVAWYNSVKLGKTLRAYRFTAPGDTWPSFWYPEGLEVPHRLSGPPLQDYQQITSLLKDRPSHKGMDFKTPVGTPVLATRDGVVTRSNWSFAGNGNCLEIRFTDGVLAKYLHLEKNLVQPGDRVTRGQVIAHSGNTGRSTAPHLHYQLDKGPKNLDPVDYHGTVRRQLNPEVMPLFQAEMNRLDALMAQAVASAP